MSSEPPATPALWPLAIVAGAAVVGAVVWSRPPAGAESADAATPGASAPTGAAASPPPAAASAAGAAPSAGADCPASQLPDDGVCLPVPPPEDSTSGAASAPIELLPGRTPDLSRYVTPIVNHAAAVAPDGLGLFVAAPRGVPVTALSLEAQSGQTRRWVTATRPPRLLTLHRVERSGSTRLYVVAYSGIAFDTPAGMQEVAVGTPLGRVASGPGITGLTLHVRQLRRGVEPENIAPERLLLDASSLACDPRNVLPLKPSP